MVHVLERAHVLEGARALAADADHRHVAAKRVRDARHRIGDAGSRGDEGDARLARRACPAFGAVRGGLLVAQIDDADVLIEAPVVDALDVTAA